MGASAVFTCEGINTVYGLIDHVVDFSFDPGLQEILNATDGRVYPEFAAVMAGRPIMSFTTTGIANFLSNISELGIGAVDLAATAYFQALTNYGTRAGATSHLKILMTRGMMIPRTLSAEQNTVARIAADVIAISSDGSTAPVTLTASQSIGHSAAADEQYTVGSSTLNNTAVDGVQAINIDFGIQEIIAAGKGLPYATFVARMRVAPIVTVTSLDMDLLATYGFPGAARSALTNVVFSQVVQGGVVNGTSKTFTVNEGRIVARQGRATQDGQATVDIMIIPTYNGTNNPLVLS